MADRHVKDTWSVFKIMGEFVEGFETLRSVWPSVSIFGGSRVSEGSRYYGDAVQIAQGLSKAGFSIITGGGPGLMEAANRGARIAGGSSIGLNIKLASSPDDNKYADTVINFNYFFARKVMFVKYACGIVGMPGGFGTLDEIFEALTLVQTRKIKSLPVVLYGREYWGGLIEWIETRLVREGLISVADLALFSVTDDPDQVTEIIKNHFDRVQPECNGKPGDGRNVP